MNKYINMTFFPLCLCAMILSACGKVEVKDLAGDKKRIELSEVPRIGFPPQAAYADSESRLIMSTSAMEACPNGYKKLKEQYIADRGDGRDMMAWEIKCLDADERRLME